MFYFLEVATFGEQFTSLLTSVISIITSVFGFITGNWLLMGSLAISVVVPIIFTIFTYFRNKG